MANSGFLLPVLLLVILYASSCSSKLEVYVSKEGKNNRMCLQSFNRYTSPCSTLDYVAENVVIGTTVVILGTLEVTRLVKFQNVTDINIMAVAPGTQIHCTNTASDPSGFIILSVSNIRIENLTIRNCGVPEWGGERMAAVHFQNCQNVILQNVVITEGRGTGVHFFNTYGAVFVKDVNFLQNGHQTVVKSGGMLVNFTHSPHCSSLGPELCNEHGNYLIGNCYFENNTALGYRPHLGLGGALGLFFLDTSKLINITIENVTLVQNKAGWGGGMYIGFRHSSYNNTVTIINTTYNGNFAYYGGGGTDFGYYSVPWSAHMEFTTVHTNEVLVQDCTFIQNEAVYGGGSAIYASHTPYGSRGGETVSFENCTWIKNLASFSPAVDISPFIYDTLNNGYLPVPVFTNCKFIANAVKHLSGHKVNITNVGAFIVTTFTVQFGGSIVFRDHLYTALHVTSGIIHFKPGTTANFVNNTGVRGGAIALYGFSLLQLQNGSRFNFKENYASEVGGAIYHHSFDQHDFVSTRTCFIQYTGPRVKDLTIRFESNKATHKGTSIFSLSFYPCYFKYFSKLGTHSMYEVFDNIANFVFDDPREKALATAGSLFVFTGTKPLLAIPGKKLAVPLTIKDELNNTVHTMYRLSLMGVKSSRHYINNTLRLYGNPGDNGTLVFYTLSSREVSFSVAVSLQQCPPGYFLKDGVCECAADYEEHEYPGISKCQKSLFQAYIKQGYWAGYKGNETLTPDNLYTAPCPSGLCTYQSQLAPMYLLPPNSSFEDLSSSICAKNRTGYLCGKCRDELSVYYHSDRFRCGEVSGCKFGVLYFILSELLPLVLFFTTVVALDISFTSGCANSFIFFSQVLDPLSVDAKGAIHFPRSVDKLSQLYKIVYGLFNFEFFSIDSLSFCLWKQATILDMLAFKYVTTAFAFLLVLCLIAIMRCCNCRRICELKMKVSMTDSVINGLAAFLVICYGQCTRVSFQILTSVTLVGEGGIPGPRVTFYGGIPYFEGKHFLYAVPACICVVTIVTIPPLLLFGYPLYLQVLSLCGLKDILRCIPVGKLKPLLDTFQGCYKDNFRFFAGLYFMYRVAFLAAYAFSKSINSYYVTVEGLIISIVGLHSVAQPYENKCHNIIDSLILVNLALINGFTIYTYNQHGPKNLDLWTSLNTIFWAQLVLIYIPLICVSCYIVSKIAKRVKKRLQEMKIRNGLENQSLDIGKTDESPDYVIDHEHLPYQELELSTVYTDSLNQKCQQKSLYSQ